MVKDKWSARRSRFRIPEYSLFCLAVLGGAIGVGAAMLVVRHKTRHLSFWAVVFCSILIHLSLLFWLFGRD
ncbi:MAG: DUF1294 domain-containing protein [Brevibacillus sp.]|nr:DUF1294 domain-containing protein [Brevibacillus sp.]